MNFFNYIFNVLFLAIIYLPDLVKSECRLSLNEDFGEPHPIFYRHNSYELWRPEKDGFFSLKEGASIKASCGGTQNPILVGDVAFSNNSVAVECVNKQTFRVGLWESPFKGIKCTRQPPVHIIEVDKDCFRSYKMNSVGYRVEDRFIAIYDACFDRNVLTTLYVVHTLRPLISSYKPKPESQHSYFGGTFLYGNFSIKNVYSYDYQKNKVDDIIGQKVRGEFLNEDVHLVEKLLVPPTDLSLYVEQKAAYHYVNIVPQWKYSEKGDWDLLESALRMRVIKKGAALTIYTGAFGAVTLPGENGVHRELYWEFSRMYNNKVLPVPMYFYKMVHDTTNNTATVFISINSPHYNVYELEQLVFCDDVCKNNPKFSWLKWKKEDNITSFCCNYPQVQEYVFTLPKLENIQGLYY